MKKLIALILCTLLVGSMCVAAAGDFFILSAPTVHVRIEDIDKNLFCGSIAYKTGMTALEAALEAIKQAGLEATTSVSPYGGMYISAIGDRQEGAFGGYEGWMYYVNGESPMYSIANCPLEPGQQLLVAFADMSVLQPIVEAGRADGQVKITVTADVTTYDENWNATVTRQPIVGATVTADGKGYTTDEQGAVTLPEESAAKERISLQVEQYSEEGLPLVLRLAPDFMLELPGVTFTDVAEGSWYAECVRDMAAKGLMNGYPDGSFAPNGTVTRAMAAKVLFELSGGVAVEETSAFSDVEDGRWYAEAVHWAAANGVVQGRGDGTFGPDAPISRQDLAVMLMNYRVRVVKSELPDLGFGAPAFADNADIADYAAEAVYLLQKAGVLTGSEGKFLPRATATRAQLCKMVWVLMNID